MRLLLSQIYNTNVNYIYKFFVRFNLKRFGTLLNVFFILVKNCALSFKFSFSDDPFTYVGT